MSESEPNDVKNQVAHFIQGKHGLIGIILPDKETTQQEWEDFHKSMVEIAVRRAIRKGKEEAE